MPERIEIQIATEDPEPPDTGSLRTWAETALDAAGRGDAAITVRIIDADEASALNRDYRGRDYATNVLSFPFAEVAPEAMAALGGPYLGDLAICAAVVEREAAEQGKTRDAHWAHMIVHGVLHLAGFDHDSDDAAEHMEAREREILARLGFPDPYAEPAT